MPVCTCQFNGHRIIVPHFRTESPDEYDQQRDHPAQHMKGVQSKNDVQKLTFARPLERYPCFPQLAETDDL